MPVPNLKKYRSIANRSLQNVLAYRTSYVITFLANSINLLAIYFCGRAFIAAAIS